MATSVHVNGDSTSVAARRKVLFFDIDNCLYPKSYRIQDYMGDLIDKYFMEHLSLSREDAVQLHQTYYKDYGLAIIGLVNDHKIDALEYNRKVDDALPLDDIIKPDPKLRRLLEDFDRSKVKLWLFTNAYITHGQRVVKLLEIDDLFEGITYCDYGAEKLLCKPTPAMFEKAMREAGVTYKSDCYFIDDNAYNVAGGRKYGWRTAHLIEPEAANAPSESLTNDQIRSLEELRTVFPELFKHS